MNKYYKKYINGTTHYWIIKERMSVDTMYISIDGKRSQNNTIYYDYQRYDDRFEKISENAAYPVSGSMIQRDIDTFVKNLEVVTDPIELAKFKLLEE
jgi:hypothetical protein